MSLLRTAARASVATRVIGGTHRRQQQRWAAEDAAQASAAPPPHAPVPAVAATDHHAGHSVLDRLTQLGHLRDTGVLTEAEFQTQKARILAESP